MTLPEEMHALPEASEKNMLKRYWIVQDSGRSRAAIRTG